MTRVCVDIMGSDQGPQTVLDGIEAALLSDADLEVLVAGPQEVVEPFVEKHPNAYPLFASEWIRMDEHPVQAVRAKKDASLVKGCAAVAKGDADAFFSPGSTGAILTAATFGIGRIKSVKRPALAVPAPGLSGRRTIFMDTGANADVRPEMMAQFAQMGRAYAKVALGVADPCVALFSNGSEKTKGSENSLAAHAALEAAGPWFVGNCEGTDLLAGRYDVIVTDGFTGNIAVKTLEGTAKYLVAEIKKATKKSFKAALGALLLKSSLKQIAATLSGDEYGGVVLLGVKAPVFIGHGSTSVKAIKNGTRAAAQAVRSKLIAKIEQELLTDV